MRKTKLALLTSRNSSSFFTLFLLLGLCTLFYYFGELVDLAGWKALRWGFFYSVHDVHRLLFLAPIIYAGYVFGVRAVTIITIISAGAMLPRALFISAFPDPLLRAMLTIAIAGTMGYLTARVRAESERYSRLEALVRGERDKLSGIVAKMEDGVITIRPDYRIQFLNPSMIRDFGEGTGSYCYAYLHNLNRPCPQICRLPEVIKGAIERWEHTFPDGRTYEVVASPHIDADGVICLLAVFRNITHLKKVGRRLNSNS